MIMLSSDWVFPENLTKNDMNYKITYNNGQSFCVPLPASKSITNRMLIIQALSGEKGCLQNIAKCDDTDAMLKAFSDYDNGQNLINIGAAGTAMRFLTAYFALKAEREITLDGSERMRQRPIKELVDTLKACGADIEYISINNKKNNTCPPLKIKGKQLKAETIEINGNISSQYISAIMMISPYLKGGAKIKIIGESVSRPYIEMTASLMNKFGAKVTLKDSEIIIEEGKYSNVNITVESDWSAASYWYEIKSIIPNLEIVLIGLNKCSDQGDSHIAEYFTKLGVTTTFTEKGVALGYDETKVTDTLTIDLADQPDLAQTFAVTACLKGIPFKITGLSTLKIKETDRMAALISELAKLGYRITEVDNSSLIWDGSTIPTNKKIEIETYKDHRMAMAFAPAAKFLPGITILDAGVVSKSYPEYWKHLQKIGFKMEE